MATPDLSVFQRLKTKADFDREAEEFQMRKLARQQALKDLNQPDIEGAAQRALYEYNQTGNLSDQGRAAIETMATMKGSKTSYEPDAFGNIRAVTQPNSLQQFLGGINGEKATAQQSLQKLPSTPTPNTENITSPQTDFQKYMQNVDPLGAASPVGRKMIFEAELDAAQDLARMDYENDIKLANEKIKTDRGRQNVFGILNRMEQINEALRERGAIVSTDQGYFDRVGTTAETTGLGQGIRKFNDPQSQALADEYTKLQSALLPYYASAAGLGAKSLDSEGERKTILDSFGSPSGIYDSNKNQLNNLRKLFGGEQQQPDYSGFKILGIE